jgi:hypothetical protein
VTETFFFKKQPQLFNKQNHQFNEIVQSTMKSKQVWMKSKPYGFDEIKSVFISAEGDFICEADFILRMRIYPVARRI